VARADAGSSRGLRPAPGGPPVLREPQFRVLLSSFVFSQLPVNMMNFVLLMRLFEMTGSSLATSLLWLANAIPAVILGPMAGAVADMRDRKRILIVINLIRSLIVLGLAVSRLRSPLLIYGLVLVYSSLNQFYGPAEFACLPCLLPVEGFPKATSTLFIAQQATVFAGFSLGGGLIPLLGASGTLGVCAAMIFAAFVLVLMLPPMKTAPGCHEQTGRRFPGLLKRIAEGNVFLAKQLDVLGPFLLLLSGQSILSVIIVNVPAISNELLHMPAAAAGLAVVAPFAAGALAGSVTVPRFIAKEERRGRVVDASLALIGVCMGLLITVAPSIRGWPRGVFGAALSACFGFAIVGLMVPSRTSVQERTPEGLQGRVSGSLSVLGNIVSIVPVVLSGTIAHLIGVRAPLAVLGFACFAGLALWRRLGRLVTCGSSFPPVPPLDLESDGQTPPAVRPVDPG